MNFDVEKITDEVIAWIRQFFNENGNGCNAIIGISGGKDSSVAAALCVKALGKELIIGLVMPNRKQSDLSDACDLENHLGIQYYIVDIGEAVDGILKELATQTGVELSEQTIWEDTPGQSHNFISGCCAVGSAPALGARCREFESPHSDKTPLKSSDFRGVLLIL